MSRFFPGIVMTAFWVLLLLAGTVTHFWLVIILMAVVGLLEYYTMTLGKLSGAARFLSIAVAMIPAVVSILQRPELVMAGLFVSLFGTILLSQKYYASLDNVLYFMGLTSFGALYISFGLAHLVFIRFMPQGVSWLLVLTAVTAGADTGAYYIGKNFGRHKLCPVISPGKTVEGAIGGIVVGSTAAVLAGILLLPECKPAIIFTTAMILSLVSIIGDLAESIIKRSSGVKDSGSLLSGHGGLLDRIDSLLIASPVLFYLHDFGAL